MSEEEIVVKEEVTYYVFIKNDRRHYAPQILSDGETTVQRWDITKPKKNDERLMLFGQRLRELTPLFGMEDLRLAYQSFSPDGNRYVVGIVESAEEDGPQSPYFVAVPVTPIDKKHPDFLDADNLTVLGQVAGITSIAWIAEPTSYVVSNSEFLYKWDLDELPRSRVFEMPKEDGERKTSIFRRFGHWFGGGDRARHYSRYFL